MFGLFKKWYRKRQAKKHGISFRREKFWPYYWWTTKGGICDGCKVISPLFTPKVPSGVYPILESDTHLHCYKLLSSFPMPGGDWGGVSNVAYVIEYHHSEPRPNQQQEPTE